MEQSKYCMGTRRKLSKGSHVKASTTYNYDSWEEQAFADDSAGLLGGFNWPPRSYSCSFCRKEFRSAQALGGHMNVHRRDRARLKQYAEPPNTQILQHQNPLDAQCPSKVGRLVYINPNCNPNVFVDVASPLSPSKVSAPSSASSSHSSTIAQEHQKGPLFSVILSAGSESKLEGDKNLKSQEVKIMDQEEYVKADSPICLNLVVGQSRNRLTGSGCDNEDEGISRKKRMIDETCLPFFLKPSTVDPHHLQSEINGLSTGSMEELDLELRLGFLPEVN